MTDKRISMIEVVGSVDAELWTKFWLQTINDNHNIPYDEETMIGWFANAIQSGINHEATKHILEDAGVSSMAEYVDKVLLGKE